MRKSKGRVSIFDIFSSRLRAGKTFTEIDALVRRRAPDVPWSSQLTGQQLFIGVENRWKLTGEDCKLGVKVQMVELDWPGDNEPPYVLVSRIARGERVTFMTAFESNPKQKSLQDLIQALILRGRITGYPVHWSTLRVNAVYEVIQPFKDEYGAEFPAGTRLTFQSRNFVPYHGGHTIHFKEATIYLHESSAPCSSFDQFFAVSRVGNEKASYSVPKMTS